MKLPVSVRFRAAAQTTMQLSDDLFDNIRKTLGLSGAATWEARRGRRATRLETVARVPLEPFGQIGGRGRMVTLADLS